jgi:hypothetical protein
MSNIQWADLFSAQISNVIKTGNKKLFSSGNPMAIFAKSPLEGNPKSWAKDIFLGMSNKLDNVQRQTKATGDNTLSDGNQGGVQYTGKGNNTGKADYLAQITEKGDNTGTGKKLFQYTADGTNTATAVNNKSKAFQYNEHGDNKTKGDVPFARVNQFTAEGNNSATGKNVYQYTKVGNNNATGTGKNSYAVQTSDEGNNTATNAQFIYQQAKNGKNTAIGTDGNDEIIQQGGGTANGGAGDDVLTVLDSDSGTQDYSMNGGDGFDKIKLYGQEDDWSKQVTDGKVIYKNTQTGDTVTTQDVEDVEYGAKPPEVPPSDDPPPPCHNMASYDQQNNNDDMWS